jgi:effector-binding domain-containing protein
MGLECKHMNLTDPKFEIRNEQPYVAIRVTGTEAEMSDLTSKAGKELTAWLAGKGILPTGPLFYRYIIVEKPTKMTVDVGVPLESKIAGEGRVSVGVIPAGKYLVATHTGPREELLAANHELTVWGMKNDVKWEKYAPTHTGEEWEGCVMRFISHRGNEPDPQKWQTELAFLTAEY